MLDAQTVVGTLVGGLLVKLLYGPVAGQCRRAWTRFVRHPLEHRRRVKAANAKMAWEGVAFMAHVVQEEDGREIHGWPTWYREEMHPQVSVCGVPVPETRRRVAIVKNRPIGFRSRGAWGVVLYRDGSSRIVDKETWDLCEKYGMSTNPYQPGRTRRYLGAP